MHRMPRLNSDVRLPSRLQGLYAENAHVARLVIMLRTSPLPTKEYYPTNQRYQDCHKSLISLVGKLPTKSTNRGDLVGW